MVKTIGQALTVASVILIAATFIPLLILELKDALCEEDWILSLICTGGLMLIIGLSLLAADAYLIGKDKEMKTIEIYWEDLTEKKQQEILEEFGDNMNWDYFPMATIEIEDDVK